MNYRIPLFVLLGLTLCLLPIHGEDNPYSGGEGTEENPYQISTAEDWFRLSGTPGHWSQHFALEGDIDFENAALHPIGSDQQGKAFTGTFDGKKHTVRNGQITVGDKSSAGLFGALGKGGVLKNISVESFTVTGKMNVGGLVGFAGNGSTIDACSSAADVSGLQNVGGLAGRQEMATIKNSSASGKVTGSSIATGGFLGLSGGSGWASGGTISRCRATGAVTGAQVVGGFVGSVQGGTISHCSASGTVTGKRTVGGFAGGSDDTVTSCFATGAVKNEGPVSGGFVGSSSGTISECYSTGNVSGNADTGGLAGKISGRVFNCYALGNAESAVNYSGALAARMLEQSALENCYAVGTVKGKAFSGGLVGKKSEGSTIQNCYWQQSDADKADESARSKEVLTGPQDENTFQGWDFEKTWSADEDQSVNKGYPYLKSTR